MRPLRIILAAGGTGGHVFPALAAASALHGRGHRVVIATDVRGRQFESDIETATVVASGLSGNPGEKLLGALTIARGVLQAWRLIGRGRADVVVGFGGFPSLPTMIAAILRGRATVIHDQNAVLGRVNRKLASRVTCIATAFPAVRGVQAEQATYVGNPVRRQIAAIGARPYAAPQAEGPIAVLIFGGSQGARVLSAVLPAALAALPAPIKARLSIVQQCRPEDLPAVEAAYRDAGLQAELAAFFGDMPQRLAAAHLVIARAGASTVAELAAAGRPAILIPFAAALDDHQTANASALVEAGGAWRIAEADATPERLAAEIERILSAPDGLAAAAAAALTAGRPDAAEALADLIQTAAKPSDGRGGRSTAIRGIAA